MAAPARNVNIGVVGWGGRAGSVARTGYEATGGLMVPVACVEPHDDNYAKGCTRFLFRPRRYLSVKEMLAKEKLDGLIIGSPNQFHLENLKDCKGQKMPILLEKPLESSFAKICAVVRFTRAYQGPVLVGHCMRYAPILREARKMLDRGDIGTIASFQFQQSVHYGNTGFHNWRRRKDLSGTWMLEKATHDFDALFWLIRDLPASVAAIQKLQAYGGKRANDLRCRACPDRLTCPESIQNTARRWGHLKVEEFANADDLCVFADEVDTPDNDRCLIDFRGGVFGTYGQWFFSPRSYHHRLYEIQGTEGAMEIDLGAEFGGDITVCQRYGTHEDKLKYHFDYLQRNHYNGDGDMTRHFFQIINENAKPETTVEQAFMAEVLGFAAMRSSETRTIVDIKTLLPDDLKDIYQAPLY